jgi:multiple sugar transport system ATP-binding protein
MATVRLEHIDKVYPRGKQVLSDLSLEIKDQEFLVLVGPSGCGKSTILRIIAGLEEATRGSVWIGERNVTGVQPKDRDIAMVFQNYALYPHMSAYDNIAFGLRLRRTQKEQIDDRVREAARILNIGSLLEKMPKALSGGERQRVALGRAIVRQPQVFLFDEPLSNLDAKLRSEMRAEISALHQRLKVTTVYVTHDQVEAMTMGERIVVLKEGDIHQVGEPLTIYQKPSNRFVAGFIGSPSMNFLDARVTRGNGLRLDAGKTVLSVPQGERAGIDRYTDRRITLGLRPEDLRLDETGDISARVTLVEPTGGESYIYAEIDEVPIVARARGAIRLGIGETVRFRMDLERAHFFDPETEERISR